MPDDIKTISIKEFREEGYLQEVNRKFLHPLGLALSVNVHEDGTETLAGVWDYRDDPEGILFGDLGAAEEEKALRIEEERLNKVVTRNGLGCDSNGIQPVNGISI